jgi:hypothetical protein
MNQHFGIGWHDYQYKIYNLKKKTYYDFFKEQRASCPKGKSVNIFTKHVSLEIDIAVGKFTISRHRRGLILCQYLKYLF